MEHFSTSHFSEPHITPHYSEPEHTYQHTSTHEGEEERQTVPSKRPEEEEEQSTTPIINRMIIFRSHNTVTTMDVDTHTNSMVGTENLHVERTYGNSSPMFEPVLLLPVLALVVVFSVMLWIGYGGGRK